MKYWYGFWAVFCSIAALILAVVGVMCLFAFGDSDSSRSFDMGVMGFAGFGVCMGIGWIFLSATIYLFGKSFKKENLIKMAGSMLP